MVKRKSTNTIVWLAGFRSNRDDRDAHTHGGRRPVWRRHCARDRACSLAWSSGGSRDAAWRLRMTGRNPIEQRLPGRPHARGAAARRPEPGPPPAAPIAGQVLGIRPEIVGAELGKMAAKAGWGLGECQGTRVIYRHALRSSGDAETHASQEVALQPRRMTKAERVGLQVHGYSVS